ncbi:hypothetical protein WJX82_011164 [Trebouxia sp. C0006]
MDCELAPIVSLNVGGTSFTTSRDTLCKDSHSMLARMFSGSLLSRRDEKGRVFLDRDPKHFRLILNYLRDGEVCLPACPQELQEILQEALFYQLDGLRLAVSVQERWLPNSASQLRTCISEQLQSDGQLKNAVDLIVDCAFGRSPYSDTSQIPTQSTCVDVAVRESAYNPLHPQNQLQQQDETLYVAFQQRIQIKGETNCELFDAKHESHLLHHDGQLSYDPKPYGVDHACRFHIKTMQVYRHHCVSALSAKHQRWRDCALYIVKHINAVKWALDLCGFRDVAIPVHSMQVNSTTDGAQSAVLVNIRFSVQLSL